MAKLKKKPQPYKEVPPKLMDQEEYVLNLFTWLGQKHDAINEMLKESKPRKDKHGNALPPITIADLAHKCVTSTKSPAVQLYIQSILSGIDLKKISHSAGYTYFMILFQSWDEKCFLQANIDVLRKVVPMGRKKFIKIWEGEGIGGKFLMTPDKKLIYNKTLLLVYMRQLKNSIQGKRAVETRYKDQRKIKFTESQYFDQRVFTAAVHAIKEYADVDAEKYYAKVLAWSSKKDAVSDDWLKVICENFIAKDFEKGKPLLVKKVPGTNGVHTGPVPPRGSRVSPVAKSQSDSQKTKKNIKEKLQPHQS